MKKILLLLVLLFLFLFPKSTLAQDKSPDNLNIYFFWGQGCPHCAKEAPFLKSLEDKYPQVRVYDFEVWGNSKNLDLFIKVGKALKVEATAVPFTVIGNKYFVGYYNDQISGREIEEYVKYCLNSNCQDVVGDLLEEKKSENNNVEVNQEKKETILQELQVPLIGSVATKNLSLPVLTVLIGALDGFNPCAMWILLFLISLLIGMHDKRRMWILGSAFIIASAFVYFLFMAAWLNLILFLGFIIWVRILVGLIALIGGGYNLREYIVNKEGGCKVTQGEKRQKILEKIKQITREKSFWLSLGGIIILAFAVNLVELICSAGFPVVYTQVLAFSNLAKWQYYLYLLLYIFVFMFDDLFVFVVAMKTLEMTGITTKYTRLSHLIGGILMILVGFLLIFKPQILMFG